MELSQDMVMAIIGVKEVELVASRMRIADLERQLANLSKSVPVEGDCRDCPPDGPQPDK